MSSIYLYIFEDGEIRESTSEPTRTDYECIADGILTVLWVAGGGDVSVQQLDHKGEGHFLEEAKTDSAGTGATAEYFHTP